MAFAKKAAPFAKKADDKQDAKTMKGMNSFQKASFKKADSKMDAKKLSAKADMKKDTALKNKIMKKGK